MAKKNQKITVEGQKVTIINFEGRDYISLTDMVRSRNSPGDVIRNWLRSSVPVSFLLAWEKIHNPIFNLVAGNQIKNEAGLENINFVLSVKQWIAKTGAIGLISKAGRYGGTYAHQTLPLNLECA